MTLLTAFKHRFHLTLIYVIDLLTTTYRGGNRPGGQQSMRGPSSGSSVLTSDVGASSSAVDSHRDAKRAASTCEAVRFATPILTKRNAEWPLLATYCFSTAYGNGSELKIG